MKKSWFSFIPLLLMMLVVGFGLSVSITGCANPPSSQAIEQRTIGAIGELVDAGMKTSAQMLKDGRITADQWRKIATFHDQKFQPVYNTALAASQMNPSGIASPDLVKLSEEFGNLVKELQK